MVRDAIRIVLSFSLAGCLSVELLAQQPQVAITRRPGGIMQEIGGTTQTDHVILANAGNEAVSVSASGSSNFFNATPSSFILQPRTTQTVTIRPAVTSGGYREGTLSFHFAGYPNPLQVPVRLFIASRPAGSTTPGLGSSFIIVSGRTNEPHSATFNISNFGSVTMQGTLIPDVPWIVAPSSLMGVVPSGTERVPFTVQPSLRPDGQNPYGALIGSLSMVYLRGTSSDVSATQLGRITATVVDITKASVVPQQPLPLAPGEIASFLTGIRDTFGTSHIFLSNRTTTAIPVLQLFYSGAGASAASSLLASFGQFPGGGSAWFPYAPGSIFDVTNQSGSVQMRTPQPELASISGLQSVITDQSLYLTALPVLTSSSGAAGGDALIFSGVETSGAASTELHVQETAGYGGSFTAEFFSEAGTPLAPSRSESIQPFGYVPLTNVVPSGARSVRISNTSSSAAQLSGYAAVVDSITRDRWMITDPRRRGAASAELFIPMPAITPPASGALDVWVTNGSASPASVTIATGPVEPGPVTPSRRRIVGHATGSPLRDGTANIVETFTLAPAGTRKVTISDPANGHVRVHGPAGAISATGRLVSAAPPRAGLFGTGIPALPSAAALSAGSMRQFSLADDQPNFSPPALLLLETGGQPATVRVTMRFSFPGGSTVTGQAEAVREYQVPADQLLAIPNISGSVIGDRRDDLGRLFKVVFDVEVVGGNGRVLPFLQIIDPSGDLTLFAD